MKLSVLIPTYQREHVLLETCRYLFVQLETLESAELLLIDQTESHAQDVHLQLEQWHESGKLRWIKHQPVGTVAAMNRGLHEAHGDLVLFLDDDIIPGDALLMNHIEAHRAEESAWAVVGQVLQPEDGEGMPVSQTKDRDGIKHPCQPHRHTAKTIRITEDLDFQFNGARGAWVSNVMAGNLSVKREKALAIGGFDEHFTPPVAYRFETEFAKRVIASGGAILFEPTASIKHLRAQRGGTRTLGDHKRSVLPVHGVGDYYYALKCGYGWSRCVYILKRPFREVRTKFHLRHPWWIPVKLIGEFRALWEAYHLYKKDQQSGVHSHKAGCRK